MTVTTRLLDSAALKTVNYDTLPMTMAPYRRAYAVERDGVLVGYVGKCWQPFYANNTVYPWQAWFRNRGGVAAGLLVLTLKNGVRHVSTAPALIDRD